MKHLAVEAQTGASFVKFTNFFHSVHNYLYKLSREKYYCEHPTEV